MAYTSAVILFPFSPPTMKHLTLLLGLINSPLILTERMKIAPFGPDHTPNFQTTSSVSRPIVSNLNVNSEDPVFIANKIFSSKVTSYKITNQYSDDHSGISHFYACQLYDGIPVVNAYLNLHINKRGEILAMGDSGLYQGQGLGVRKFQKADLNGLMFKESGSDFLPEATSTSSFWSKVLKLFSFNNIDVVETEQDVMFKPQIKKQVLEDPLITPQHAFYVLCQRLGLDFNSEKVTLESDITSRDADGVVKFNLNNPLTRTPVKVKPSYINTEKGLRLAWSLEADFTENWFDTQVDAENGEILRLVDWVSNFAEHKNDGGGDDDGDDDHDDDDKAGKFDRYRVYPLGTNDPFDGDRVLLKAPARTKGSRHGWQSTGKKIWKNTRGNNVKASDGGLEEGQNRPAGTPNEEGGLDFDYELDLNKEPRSYIAAAVTNLFYWNNVIHDLFYQYGFNEVSGNFQQNNYESGGEGDDYVEASAQDSSGYNNANFATPPDGQNGRMRMYVWNLAKPYRDGDLEGGIIVHEYAHGISTRLTGGPANSGCLGWGESGGMGEGWGDTFATILRLTKADKDDKVLGMGNYASNSSGIRHYPYARDLKINPSTYKYLDKPAYWGVHAIGEVWAVILYEVAWELINKMGFTEDWYCADVNYGNTLFLRLLVDGMKLQPCNPKFFDARDAILAAEKEATNGTHRCDIWRGFAKRGLGPNAKLKGGTPWGGGIRTEDYDVPTDCQ